MPDIFVSKDELPEESTTLEMKAPLEVAAMPSDGSHKRPHNHHKSSHKRPSVEQLKKSVGYKSGPLSAYCYYPSGVDFMNKDEEEQIILVLRKHPITNLPWIFISSLMLVAPLALDLVPFLSFLPGNFQIMAILIWYLVTFAFILEEFLSWFFNVNIVTDERLFDVDFHNLLYREITDAHLDQIQDVTVRIGSAVRTIFNYGDVLIQTAGEVPNIEFLAVPHPDRVAKILRELRVEEEVEKIEGRVR